MILQWLNLEMIMTDYCSSNGRSKECLDFGCILKVQPIGFTDGLDIECEGKRRMSNWMNLITSLCTLVSYLFSLVSWTINSLRIEILVFSFSQITSVQDMQQIQGCLVGSVS